MDSIIEYLEEEYKSKAKKGQTMEEYVLYLVSGIKNLNIGTHLGKFSNVDSKVILCDITGDSVDGYITTAKCSKYLASIGESELDFANAASLGVANLLRQSLSDGRKLYRAVLDGDDIVYEYFRKLGVDVEQEIRLPLMKKLDAFSSPDSTDMKLRQVYFPTDVDDYVLFTVLESSIRKLALFKLRKELKEETINRGIERKKDAERCVELQKTAESLTNFEQTELSELNVKSYEYTNLPKVGFAFYGGAQPQNISLLNSMMCKGEGTVLLPCLPPEPVSVKGLIPKSLKVFLNVERVKQYAFCWKETLRKQAVDSVIDDLMIKCVSLQDNPSGWTKDIDIPAHMRIWVDDQFAHDRLKSEFRKAIADDFSTSFKAVYQEAFNSKFKSKSIKDLVDSDYELIRRRFVKYLEEECNGFS